MPFILVAFMCESSQAVKRVTPCSIPDSDIQNHSVGMILTFERFLYWICMADRGKEKKQWTVIQCLQRLWWCMCFCDFYANKLGILEIELIFSKRTVGTISTRFLSPISSPLSSSWYSCQTEYVHCENICVFLWTFHDLQSKGGFNLIACTC